MHKQYDNKNHVSMEGAHIVVILCIDVFYGSVISTRVCRLLTL